jgi:hypothetical protein
LKCHNRPPFQPLPPLPLRRTPSSAVSWVVEASEWR